MTETKITVTTEIATYRVEPRHFGEGSYGTVHLATDERGTEIAAKKIRRDPKVEHLTKDIDKLLQLEHENIVRILDKEFKDEHIWIFMEYCPKKDLNAFMMNKTLPINKLLDTIFIPSAHGLVYLHQQNIVHRDIKPDNILIGNDGKAKLTDFDLCKALGVNEKSNIYSSGGAELYKAPEYFMEPRRYKRSIDVFAFGLTIHAVMGNKWRNNKLAPWINDRFPTIGQVMYFHKGNVKVATDADPSKTTSLKQYKKARVNQLINEMTRYQQENRPTASKVLKELWDIRIEQPNLNKPQGCDCDPAKCALAIGAVIGGLFIAAATN